MVPLRDTVAIRGSNAGCTRAPSFVAVDFLARDETPSSSSRANERADLLLLGPSEREFCVRYNRESEFRAGGFRPLSTGMGFPANGKKPVTVRTTRTTISFSQPFKLRDLDDI